MNVLKYLLLHFLLLSQNIVKPKLSARLQTRSILIDCLLKLIYSTISKLLDQSHIPLIHRKTSLVLFNIYIQTELNMKNEVISNKYAVI